MSRAFSDPNWWQSACTASNSLGSKGVEMWPLDFYIDRFCHIIKKNNAEGELRLERSERDCRVIRIQLISIKKRMKDEPDSSFSRDRPPYLLAL
jgi:hypothetical protein